MVRQADRSGFGKVSRPSVVRFSETSSITRGERGGPRVWHEPKRACRERRGTWKGLGDASGAGLDAQEQHARPCTTAVQILEAEGRASGPACAWMQVVVAGACRCWPFFP